MPEQTTVYNKDGSVTIIATMVPATPEEKAAQVTAVHSCGLQLLEETDSKVNKQGAGGK